MIFFCEDCGEKNDLDERFLMNGRVIFQCRICGYHNAYRVCVPPMGKQTDRNSILEKICFFPRVIGLFLYHLKKGVLDTRMPSLLTQPDIETLGRKFTQTYVKGRSVCPDLQGLAVVIADKHFTVNMVQPDLFIVIVCTTPGLPEGVAGLVCDLVDKE